jgi:hypothetical protein
MKPRKKKKWTPETFPQPQTFPSGWDGSALTSKNGHVKGEENPSQQAKNNEAVDWVPEKFPKPRTYPKNWSIDD